MIIEALITPCLFIDSGPVIEASIYAGTPELAATLHERIAERTPVETGALKADITSESYSSGETLALIYTDQTNQLTEWNRVYAAYVEGPDLGVMGMYSTARWESGQGPWQMFEKSQTEDLPYLAAWGIQRVVGGIEMWRNLS